MKRLTLYLGGSDTDATIKRILEEWSANRSDVSLHYASIHSDPAAVVRIGITHLPALVMEGELIVQGMPEKWFMALLDRLLVQDNPGN